MRKIFTLLCGVLFAAQFTTVSAQTTTKMKVYKTDGTVDEYKTSEVDSVTFSSSTSQKEELGGGIYRVNGHKFVDLGLPSGLLWAETNIGAESAADYGNYFAWGETTTKDSFTKDNYTYTGDASKLDAEHDAAYVNWGSLSRMPTTADFNELSNSANCTWTWTSQTNSSGTEVNGYKVTSTTNSNSIFIPAAGFVGNTIGSQGSNGFCWLNQGDSDRVSCIAFDKGFFMLQNFASFYGFSVRPVAEK